MGNAEIPTRLVSKGALVAVLFIVLNIPSTGRGATLECALSWSLPHRTDAEVVEVFRAGEKNEALAELRRRFGPGLRTYVRRFLAEESEIEDVLQTIWLTVFLKLDGFRSESQFNTWLFHIGRNRALSWNRKAKSRERATSAPSAESEAESKEPTALEKMLLWEQWERCEAALARLRPDERQVLKLYYFGSITYEQVARQMGLPIGTVRSKLSRSLAKLRRLLASPVECRITTGEER